jgi:hypothetical protein
MAVVMLTKKSLSQLRLALLRVASQTTKALSHCYTSLKSLLKAKWQRIRAPCATKDFYTRLRDSATGR